MKKVFLMLATALMSCAMVTAETIWTPAEGQTDTVVTWAKTFTISKEYFASCQQGNLLKLTLNNATDVIELKSNGQKLPGSRFSNIAEAESYECFMTQAMLDTCKLYGMELCGASFGITKIEILDGKAGNMKMGETIWTGYFWVDNWNTLELFKEALTVEDLSKYASMRIYHEGPENGFILNLLANWEDAGVLAKIGPSAPAEDYALQYKSEGGQNFVELDLTKVNPLTVINNVSSDRLMIQGNKEAQSAFNITDVVLVQKQNTATANYDMDRVSLSVEGIYDLLGRRVETINSNGLYIVNGKKVMVTNK
ncbi:MAG: hypothetical protein ACI30J_03030 [Paludibacteraceae bacterium]